MLSHSFFSLLMCHLGDTMFKTTELHVYFKYFAYNTLYGNIICTQKKHPQHIRVFRKVANASHGATHPR